MTMKPASRPAAPVKTKTKLQYDPKTKKVIPVAVKATSTTSVPVSGTTFMVRGDTLKLLLGFASEDGLDVSTSAKRGQVVNSYVRGAVADFVAARSKK